MRIPVSDQPVTRSFYLHVVGQPGRVFTSEELKLPKIDGLSFQVESEHDGRRLLVTTTIQPDFTKQLYADKEIPMEFSVPGAASATVTCKLKE